MASVLLWIAWEGSDVGERYPGTPRGDAAKKRVERFLDRLFGYAFALAGDEESANDLVQTCAVRALSAENVPTDEPAYRAWLFRILRNLHFDQLRRKRFEPLFSETPEEEGNAFLTMDVSSVERSMIDVLAVREGLERLNAMHREILVLIDMAGFGYQEAADLLNIPVGTVMSRLSRARASLLQLLKEDEGTVRRPRLRIVRFRR